MSPYRQLATAVCPTVLTPRVGPCRASGSLKRRCARRIGENDRASRRYRRIYDASCSERPALRQAGERGKDRGHELGDLRARDCDPRRGLAGAAISGSRTSAGRAARRVARIYSRPRGLPGRAVGRVRRRDDRHCCHLRTSFRRRSRRTYMARSGDLFLLLRHGARRWDRVRVAAFRQSKRQTLLVDRLAREPQSEPLDEPGDAGGVHLELVALIERDQGFGLGLRHPAQVDQL